MSTAGHFIDALRAGSMVFDAALGTALRAGGLVRLACLEAACLDCPEHVVEIHAGHVRAGANVLATNTFGANAYRLGAHGFGAKVDAINQVAVSLARRAAEGPCWVLGAMGPTGLAAHAVASEPASAMREAFREQAAALCAAGVDALSLETFTHPVELRLAMEGARAGCAAQVPIVASCAFVDGSMADGTAYSTMVDELAAWGAHAAGVNCVDPGSACDVAASMVAAGHLVVAQPNAGMPVESHGRWVYPATPEDFHLAATRLYTAGVHGVGGCCGTTEAHVRAVASAAQDIRGKGAQS